MKQYDVRSFFVGPQTPLKETIRVIDRSGVVSLALVIGQDGRLIHTVTDGDIRRAIMTGIDLSSPVSEILPAKRLLPQSAPVTASVSSAPEALLALMQEKGVRQVVLLDDAGGVANVALLRDLLPQELPQVQAMIMAGGFGKRLSPLTDTVPKPMLPVGEKPLMERTVEGLKASGIRNIFVTTHYLPEKIEGHFGDGADFGVSIRYVKEDQPLGTGGALGLIERPTEPLLVINGDILTKVDFQAMHAFHEEHRADMTVGVRRYGFNVPYGVVECRGVNVMGIREKPRLDFFVSAGIYLLAPSVFNHLDKQDSFHMTQVIEWLVAAGRTVVSFPITEYWLDIGRHEDYESAQRAASSSDTPS